MKVRKGVAALTAWSMAVSLLAGVTLPTQTVQAEEKVTVSNVVIPKVPGLYVSDCPRTWNESTQQDDLNVGQDENGNQVLYRTETTEWEGYHNFERREALDEENAAYYSDYGEGIYYESWFEDGFEYSGDDKWFDYVTEDQTIIHLTADDLEITPAEGTTATGTIAKSNRDDRIVTITSDVYAIGDTQAAYTVKYKNAPDGSKNTEITMRADANSAFFADAGMTASKRYQDDISIANGSSRTVYAHFCNTGWKEALFGNEIRYELSYWDEQQGTNVGLKSSETADAEALSEFVTITETSQSKSYHRIFQVEFAQKSDIEYDLSLYAPQGELVADEDGNQTEEWWGDDGDPSLNQINIHVNYVEQGVLQSTYGFADITINAEGNYVLTDDPQWWTHGIEQLTGHALYLAFRVFDAKTGEWKEITDPEDITVYRADWIQYQDTKVAGENLDEDGNPTDEYQQSIEEGQYLVQVDGKWYCRKDLEWEDGHYEFSKAEASEVVLETYHDSGLFKVIAYAEREENEDGAWYNDKTYVLCAKDDTAIKAGSEMTQEELDQCNRIRIDARRELALAFYADSVNSSNFTDSYTIDSTGAVTFYLASCGEEKFELDANPERTEFKEDIRLVNLKGEDITAQLTVETVSGEIEDDNEVPGWYNAQEQGAWDHTCYYAKKITIPATLTENAILSASAPLVNREDSNDKREETVHLYLHYVHAHSYGNTWEKDAVNHWKACLVCNEKAQVAEHTWDAGAVTTAATETAEGVTTYTCTVCGATKTEAIPKLGHSFAATWTSDASTHWHACISGDGAKADEAAHTWDAGAVTTAATEASEGVTTYTCTVCGAKKTEAIAKLTPQQTTAAGTTTQDQSQQSEDTGTTTATTKKANTLTVKAKSATVKYSKLKKKAQTLAVSKVLTVKKAKGTVTYTKSSGDKKISINKKTGKVTIKKGLKKGTYKVKVSVKAAGTSKYKAATKKVTVKITVK